MTDQQFQTHHIAHKAQTQNLHRKPLSFKPRPRKQKKCTHSDAIHARSKVLYGLVGLAACFAFLHPSTTHAESGVQSSSNAEQTPGPDKPAASKEKQNFVISYLDSIFGAQENPEKSRFIAYPVVTFAPETSWEFGVNSLYIYYANDNPKNRLSEISVLGFVTLEGQYGLHLDHANYTDQDEWFVLGKGRFQSFPLLYYGIGSDTPEDPQAEVDQFSIVLRERLLRKLAPSFYVGPEASIDSLSGVRFNFEEGAEPELPNGSKGSFNLGLGLGIVYDNRHNVLNVRDGFFSELAALHYNDNWGSDFTFWVFESDTRIFFPINARDTLAVQLYGRMTVGDVPYNELSTLGGESLLRGYYLGRFRDNHFVGTQVEYRFLPFPFSNAFLRRFGASVFGATGAVFPGPDLPTT